jgi:hypothetical protein
MPHDSSASAAPKDYCRLFEDISPSEDGSPGRAVRVLLPVFLAVAFFRASDVIRGMGRAPAGWTRVSRRRRRGVQSRSDTEKAWTDLVRLCRLLNTNRSRASRGRDCAASRRRGRPEVPRARGRVREHRRIVDPGQRLQPVRKRAGPVSRWVPAGVAALVATRPARPRIPSSAGRCVEAAAVEAARRPCAAGEISRTGPRHR